MDKKIKVYATLFWQKRPHENKDKVYQHMSDFEFDCNYYDEMNRWIVAKESSLRVDNPNWYNVQIKTYAIKKAGEELTSGEIEFKRRHDDVKYAKYKYEDRKARHEGHVKYYEKVLEGAFPVIYIDPEEDPEE